MGDSHCDKLTVSSLSDLLLPSTLALSLTVTFGNESAYCVVLAMIV